MLSNSTFTKVGGNMTDFTNVEKFPYVTYPEDRLLFQFGKTDWELDLKDRKTQHKRSFFDRIIGFDPNKPIKRTSFFDIVDEDEHFYHCIIGFRDDVSGQFTYTLLCKESDPPNSIFCAIDDGLVLVSKQAFLEASKQNSEADFMMGIIEESALCNGAKIDSEDQLKKGKLKDKYKISLTRKRQLVVNGYHYAFIASSYALLYGFDGYDDFMTGHDMIDVDTGGMF